MSWFECANERQSNVLSIVKKEGLKLEGLNTVVGVGVNCREQKMPQGSREQVIR